MEALGHSSVSRSTTISPLLVSNNTAMIICASLRVCGSAANHLNSHGAHAMLSDLLHCSALLLLQLAAAADFKENASNNLKVAHICDAAM